MPAVPDHIQEEMDGQSETLKPLFGAYQLLPKHHWPVLRHEVPRVSATVVNITLDLGAGEAVL